MTNNKKKLEIKRAIRVRYKLKNRAKGKIRLSVYRSSANIYVQAIDDKVGVTIASASTLEESFAQAHNNIDTAKKVGALVAKRLLEKNISEVVFDKGRYLYHGKVKALADAARDTGLKF